MGVRVCVCVCVCVCRICGCTCGHVDRVKSRILLCLSLLPPHTHQYMFTFQLPWLPEFAIRLHDYQAIYDSFQGKKMVSDNCATDLRFYICGCAHIYATRTYSHAHTTYTHHTHTHTCMHVLTCTHYTHTHIHTQGVHNKASFPPSLVEAYKYVFSKPGALTGPINYYRSMFTRPSRLPSKPLEMPTLLIWVRTALCISF